MPDKERNKLEKLIFIQQKDKYEIDESKMIELIQSYMPLIKVS